MKKLLIIILVLLLGFSTFAQGKNEEIKNNTENVENLLVENAHLGAEKRGLDATLSEDNKEVSLAQNSLGNGEKTAVNTSLAIALKNAPVAQIESDGNLGLSDNESYLNALKEALKNSTEIMEKQTEMINNLEQEVKSLQKKNENLSSALKETRESLISVRESLLNAQAELKASNKEINSLREKKTLIGIFGGSNTSFKGYQIGVVIGSKFGPGFLNGIVNANPKTGVLDFNLGYSVNF